MNKLKRIDCHSPAGVLYAYEFLCPGCGNLHILPVGHGNGENYARWGFNDDLERPTFTPSILARGSKLVLDDEGAWAGEWEKDAAGNPIPYICHSFVTDGHIQFLGDCTHALAGQTLDLPDWTDK